MQMSMCVCMYVCLCVWLILETASLIGLSEKLALLSFSPYSRTTLNISLSLSSTQRQPLIEPY